MPVLGPFGYIAGTVHKRVLLCKCHNLSYHYALEVLGRQSMQLREITRGARQIVAHAIMSDSWNWSQVTGEVLRLLRGALVCTCKSACSWVWVCAISCFPMFSPYYSQQGRPCVCSMVCMCVCERTF